MEAVVYIRFSRAAGCGPYKKEFENIPFVPSPVMNYYPANDIYTTVESVSFF